MFDLTFLQTFLAKLCLVDCTIPELGRMVNFDQFLHFEKIPHGKKLKFVKTSHFDIFKMKMFCWQVPLTFDFKKVNLNVK